MDPVKPFLSRSTSLNRSQRIEAAYKSPPLPQHHTHAHHHSSSSTSSNSDQLTGGHTTREEPKLVTPLVDVDDTTSSSSSVRAYVSLADSDDGATPPIPSSSSLKPAPFRSKETSSRFGSSGAKPLPSAKTGARSGTISKPGFINELTDSVMVDLQALLEDEETVILNEQRQNGSDKILVEISLIGTDTLLQDVATAGRRRNETRRWHEFLDFCSRKEVPPSPISVDLVRLYLVQAQHAKPGHEVKTLEAVRRKPETVKIWEGLPGVAETSLEEVPRIREFIRNSRGAEVETLKRKRDGGKPSNAHYGYSLQGYSLDGFTVEDDEDSEEDNVASPRQKPRSSRKPSAPTSTLSNPSPSTSSRRRPPKIIVSSAEPESADDSEIPSPTKRARTTPATPLLGTSTSTSSLDATTVQSGDSSDIPSPIQQSQTSIQQQQQPPAAVSLASLVVPTSAFAPALPLALPAFPTPIPPIPQQPLAAQLGTPLSLSELERLILSFSSLDDHRIASTLHAFGITTREAFASFVFLEADGEPLKEVFEALEEAGVPPFRRNVLWRKLGELRTAMSG
ncbi:hypothetical protein RQP46_000113 [Phenoliferia psychrophenolica]